MIVKRYKNANLKWTEIPNSIGDIIPILLGKTVKSYYIQRSKGYFRVETVRVWRDRNVCIKIELFKLGAE